MGQILHGSGDARAKNAESSRRISPTGLQINFGKYEGLQPAYSEYNIGPYRRSFRISSRIDQDKINAEKHDGVITRVPPDAEEAKPCRIEVRTS